MSMTTDRHHPRATRRRTLARPAHAAGASGGCPVNPAAPQPAGESPDQALARAQTAAQAKRLNEAGGICEDVLAANPDYPAALALLGIVMAMKNDLDRGVELMRKAIALRPGIPSWYAHLSSMCRNTYRMDEAVASGQESIRLDPNNADHLVNMSLVFVDVDDRERAIACLLRALGPEARPRRRASGDGADPAGADGFPARLGRIRMAQPDRGRQGDDAGDDLGALERHARFPTGRLLLVGDQGYGDTIQFARYIGMAAERVQDVILGCSQEMGPLLAKIPGVAQYCHRWNDVPGHAVHCRLSSLPQSSAPRPKRSRGRCRICTPIRCGWRSGENGSTPTCRRAETDRARLDRTADPSQRPPPFRPAARLLPLTEPVRGALRLLAETYAGIRCRVDCRCSTG